MRATYSLPRNLAHQTVHLLDLDIALAPLFPAARYRPPGRPEMAASLQWMHRSPAERWALPLEPNQPRLAAGALNAAAMARKLRRGSLLVVRCPRQKCAPCEGGQAVRSSFSAKRARSHDAALRSEESGKKDDAIEEVRLRFTARVARRRRNRSEACRAAQRRASRRRDFRSTSWRRELSAIVRRTLFWRATSDEDATLLE